MTEYENEDLDISFDFESDIEEMKKYPWHKTKKEHDNEAKK